MRTTQGAQLGLMYSIPVLAWTAGQYLLQQADNPDFGRIAATALEGLWTVAVLLAALLIPLTGRDETLGEDLAGGVLLVMVPLPLVSLAWLAGAPQAALLIRGQLMLCGATALMVLATWALARFFGPAPILWPARVAMGTLSTACLWLLRDQWLNWLIPV